MLKRFGAILSGLLLAGCAGHPALPDAADFDRILDGKQVALYTFGNANGMTMQITNFGARIVSLYVPDSKGRYDDVVLGFSSLDGYLHADERYFGCIVGRVANRIGGGAFVLDSTLYRLPLNDGGVNTLHGGKGFSEQVWQVDSCGPQYITMSYLSKDGDDGFPGNVASSVTYRLTDDNAVEITYRATTDKTTPLGYTNHSYFNLSGEGNGTITDHVLTIYSDSITPIDSLLIPTGAFMPVDGTPFDFRKPAVIGGRLSSKHPQMILGSGFNHNWVLKDSANSRLVHAVSVADPASGRTLDVYTDAVGVQFYDASFLSGKDTGKRGKTYLSRGGLALETQSHPSSVNRPSFPSIWVRPGEVYTSTCIYKFGTVDK